VEVIDLLTLSEALDRLEASSPRKAQLVKLRYFAGFTLPEIAEMLGISQSTAEADWTYAKACPEALLGYVQAAADQAWTAPDDAPPTAKSANAPASTLPPGRLTVSTELNGYSDWPGLEPEQLYEQRDLNLTTDFRDVLGELVTVHLGNREIKNVFPGYTEPKFRGLVVA
jgi:hypothetical protein